MEGTTSAEVEACAESVNENYQDIGRHDENIVEEISQNLSSSFLTASDLFLSRGIGYKKTKDEDLELYKGPKLYYSNESTVTDERIEDIMLDTKRGLEIQRTAKNRDCVKAEWNEEYKVAVVPYLKGKTTHMGINMRGKCALSPEEALFLLEKGSIEVVHNKMSLSVEEAHAVMLKGKLSVEKYEVYSFLSQQGFIVINHQLKNGPNFEKIMNLSNAKGVKRKAGESVELPEQKRLTFTGVLASNSEVNSVTPQTSSLISDTVLNSSNSLSSVQPVTENTPNSVNSETNLLQDTNAKINSEESEDATRSPDFTYIEFNDSTEKEATTSCFEVQDKNDVEMADEACLKDTPSVDKKKSKSAKNDEMLVKNPNNEKPTDVENTHDNKTGVEHDDNEIDVECGQDVNEIDVECGQDDNEIDVERIHDDKEIDIENPNEGESFEDLNEIIIDDEGKGDKSDDINVEDSLDNEDEYLSSDDNVLIVCEESDERSLDVYSDSQDNCEEVPTAKTNNLQNRSSNEHDDEVTLVEVKKKEKKPLAVIDLLSDEDDSSSDSGKDYDPRQPKDRTNGEGDYEDDSDDEIQVLDVFPVSTNNAQGTSRTTYSNCVKLESKKLKIPIETSNIKSSYTPRMKFPDAFRKDIICVPRPPNHLLPLHVQPAKEAYVLTTKKSSQQKSRVWNSYRDMQDYQRERRMERHTNSFNARSAPFRDQIDSFSNRLPPFSSSENVRDTGFNISNQNYLLPQNRNIFQSPRMNHLERPGPLLPSPNVFNSMSHMPFNMNIHNLQNLSSSNPVAFVNEIQKTVYSVATSMISSMLGQHLNPNPPPPTHSPAFAEPGPMGFTSHSNNNFNPSPGISGPMGYNSSGRNDFTPMRFPPEPSFSGERYPFAMNNAYTPENSWRQQNNFRQGNFSQRGPLFPCKYRTIQRKRYWNDVKAALEGTNDSNSGSDIEEVPINLNQFLWSNDIQPLVKPGTKLPVADVLKALRVTQMANLWDTNRCNDRYLPSTPSLEVSFDVYLPNSKYKRSEPPAPKYRIIVTRSSDPVPRYSELICLQRKWNDGATLQVAVVDHSDISFYSFNSLSVPEIVPFES